MEKHYTLEDACENMKTKRWREVEEAPYVSNDELAYAGSFIAACNVGGPAWFAHQHIWSFQGATIVLRFQILFLQKSFGLYAV